MKSSMDVLQNCSHRRFAEGLERRNPLLSSDQISCGRKLRCVQHTIPDELHRQCANTPPC